MMNNKLWLIWKDPKERRRYIIGELSEDSSNHYQFKYMNPELDDALKVGFNYFPGFPNLKETYQSDTLFANIATRLPNPNRPDYLEILNTYVLDMNSSKMTILKTTKGRLLTDNFEFVPIFEENKLEFEIAGISHYLDRKKLKKSLKINDNLELESENTNEKDQNAIKINYYKDNKKYQLGYVPRYYSKQLTKLLEEKVEYSAKIEKLNLDSPLNDEDVTVSVKLIFATSKELKK